MAVELTATDANFTGTGVSSTYAAPIYANNSAQIQVSVNGALQTLGDDYTLSGIGSETGISVVATFPASAAIYVERVTPIKQEVDTKNNETILEDVLDTEFDKLTMIAQEIDGKANRAIKGPKGVPAIDFDPTGLLDGDLLQYTGSKLRRFAREDFAGRYYVGDGTGRLTPASGTGNDQALRVDLATSGMGGRLIAFVQAGVGAVLQTLYGKLTKGLPVSPEDFGAVAVEDGGAGVDNYDAMMKAIQCGRPVNGHRKTYQTSQPIIPAAIKAVTALTLAWTTPEAMAAQQSLLYIKAPLSDWTLEDVGFDVGTVQNTGSVGDSDKQGLRVGSDSPNVVFCENINIVRCWATGDGNGSRFQIRSARGGAVRGCYVKPGTVASSGAISNDAANAFDFAQVQYLTVSDCRTADLATINGGVRQNKNTRGFLFVEMRDSTVQGCHAAFHGQEFDFSGGINAGAGFPQGNRRISVIGCTAAVGFLYGFKFANCARDILVSGCIGYQCGFDNFVISASVVDFDTGEGGITPAANQNSANTVAFNTQNILFDACLSIDPTGVSGNPPQPFRIMSSSKYPTWPRGIKFRNCTARAPANNADYGFVCDVVLDRTTGQFNELSDCTSYGHLVAPQTGFSIPGAALYISSPQGIPDNTPTDVGLFQELYDGDGGHAVVGSVEIYDIGRAGPLRVDAYGEYGANGTGYRRIDILKNGAIVASALQTSPPAGQTTPLSTFFVDDFVIGDNVRIQTTQTSGGGLNLVKAQLIITPVQSL